MEPRKEDPDKHSTHDIECFICLDILKEPASCQVCKKMLCNKHLSKIPNRCPHCRAEPLKVKLHPELHQRLQDARIDKLKETSQGQKFHCHVEGCHYFAFLPYMLEHRRFRHPDTDIEFMLFGPEIKSELPQAPTDEQIRQAQWVSTRANRPRPGERMKIPTYDHVLKMSRHYRQCTDQKCDKMWTGPWGTFIGGIRGDLYFDLTECAVGKRLNEEAGWIYGDWRN